MKDFPTGKQHVSFSEVKAWSECTYRHKLMYIDKIATYEENPYADFGTAIHNEIEIFLNGESINISRVHNILDGIWESKGYDTERYITAITEKRSANGWKYTHESLEEWKVFASNILNDLPEFLDETFPGWKPYKAEQELYEKICEHGLNFKGFIDCIITVPKSPKSKKVNYWIIDWKTTGKTGWWYQKKKEFLSLSQVGLYKKYWADKCKINPADIRTGYVFLKRGAPAGKTCELFKVSSGPKFIEKIDKLVGNMIRTVRNGLVLKNYNNCKFCPFKNTEHCSGSGW